MEAAVARITGALALLRPNGQRNDRAWAQQQISDALGELPGEAWNNVRRLLRDARTLNHLDWMQAKLEQAVPEPG